VKYLEARRLAQSGGNAAPGLRRAQGADRQPAPAVRASPYARKLAAELGLDLASIAGTGAGGTITLEDVRKAGGVTA